MKYIKYQLYKFKLILGTLIFLLSGLLLVFSCKRRNEVIATEMNRMAEIEPDYSGIIIPFNIAPLNFFVKEEGNFFLVTAFSPSGYKISVRSSDGVIRFPEKKWKELITQSIGGEIRIEITVYGGKNGSGKFSSFSLDVVNDKIDPFIVYRILYPGYEAWRDMKIVQRSLESFYEKSVFENQLLDNNCVNCHTFLQNNPEKFLLHVRGSKSGTYFADNGEIIKTSLKTKNMPANAVYPSWHPSGNFVAFSSNKTVQAFHSRPEKNIEVFDLFSSLVLYDIRGNEIMACVERDSVQYMETFPCWSPDGTWLYYCRTPQVQEGFDFRDVKYDLVRIPFDLNKRSFGKPEVIFDAASINKSVSFPAVSPDGKSVVFTLHDYGTFSIWHREADLYLLDTETGETVKMSVNSEESDSYHSWSSNGKWLVFSSKRDDGLSARPYFSYIYSADSAGKPFVLPQKDPGLYSKMKRTFNRPEFVTGRVMADPRDFEKASDSDAVQAEWSGPSELNSIEDRRYKNEKY